MRTGYAVLLAVASAGRLAAAQARAWVSSPERPTVGDTIWLARALALPAGWQLRAARLAAGGVVEPLGDPVVAPLGAAWLARYPVVAWAPGVHRLEVPPLWRVSPEGRVDSIAGGTASITVASVLPDTGARPAPRPLLAPLRRGRRRPLAPLGGAALAAGLLAGLVAWRARAPRPALASARVPVEPEVPDAHWLAAGEPKAVAARARWRLRAAIARAVPEAHPALGTPECLAALARGRPEAPLGELGELLEQLDRVAFGSAPASDAAALAAMARRVARELAP